MSQKTLTTLGIIALILIVFLSNRLITLTPLGARGIDLTEDSRHTLSDGSKAILSELAAPVTIRYYSTQNSQYTPRQLELYMRKVNDFLKEYERVGGNLLRVERLDPKPDTEAEDSAQIDEITGQRIDENNNLYHGICVTSFDRKETLPFLTPDAETTLEYDLSRAIALVSQVKRPKLGILSALHMEGAPAAYPGAPPGQPWLIYNQLQESYEIITLGMSPERIDPTEIDLLLIIHPAGITPETEYQIDQYLLAGGNAVACLDPKALMSQQAGPMGLGEGTTFSTLPTLLPHWGIEFSTEKVVVDSTYRTRFQGGESNPSYLLLPEEAMPQSDDLITGQLSNIFFPLAGGFLKKGGAGLTTNTLIQSSDHAALIPTEEAELPSSQLLQGFKPSGNKYDLMLRIAGVFQTAFPDGKPEASTEEEATPSQPKVDLTPPTQTAEHQHLSKGEKTGTIFLISDTDFLADQACYQVQNMGEVQILQPISSNPALFFNLLDQALGSKHLIGARSRSSSRRPFLVVQELESEFEQKVGSRITALELEQEQAVARISQLQAQKKQGNQIFLSPEQQNELEKLQDSEIESRQQIRELQKDLRKQKDQLSTRISILNITIMPLIVLLIGLITFAVRRSQTQAR